MDIRELGPTNTHLAYEAMLELRPHIGSKDEFVARVNDVQRPAGYRLVASFNDGEPVAAAAAGFWLGENLATGRYLYVDDLVTRESVRRSGHAIGLLDWVRAESERNDCSTISLDSAVHRHEAHRLYLRWGFVISSHHFDRRLNEGLGR
jgi:GNAT superfamily N-acetyltransferase